MDRWGKLARKMLPLIAVALVSVVGTLHVTCDSVLLSKKIEAYDAFIEVVTGRVVVAYGAGIKDELSKFHSDLLEAKIRAAVYGEMTTIKALANPIVAISKTSSPTDVMSIIDAICVVRRELHGDSDSVTKRELASVLRVDVSGLLNERCAPNRRRTPYQK